MKYNGFQFCFMALPFILLVKVGRDRRVQTPNSSRVYKYTEYRQITFYYGYSLICVQFVRIHCTLVTHLYMYSLSEYFACRNEDYVTMPFSYSL